LDFSTDSLKIVKEKFENNPHFKGSTLAHGLPTPLTGDTFDVVFFIETIEHILPEDLNGTLQEIHRLLRKGGYIFVTTPNQENLEAAKILCPECGCIFHRIQHIASWTKDSLSSMMKANGFYEVQCKPTRLKEDRWPESVLHGLKLLAHKLLKKPYPHLVYIGRK
jgi:ubiquinone/menaquinone biosynthesis C-methylase UbiE